MRRARVFLVLAASAALVAGCGGDDEPGGSSATKQPASKDPATLLASIKPAAEAQGPQKLSMDFTLTPKGTPSNPSIAALLSEPVKASLKGSVTGDGKKASLEFAGGAGPINLAGAIRVVGEVGYLQLSDVWYQLPLDESGASTADPAEALEAFGNPSEFIKDPTYVGSEEIEGIATEHIRGTLDVPALLDAGAKVTEGAAAGGGTAAQASAAGDEIEKLLTNSTADLWVADGQVRKLGLALTGALTPEMKASLGLDGFDATLNITTVPTDEPKVEAPSGARPAAELQSSLGGLLGGLSGLAGSTAP